MCPAFTGTEKDVLTCRDAPNFLTIKIELSLLMSGAGAVDVDSEFVCSVLGASSGAQGARGAKKEAGKTIRIMRYDNPKEDPSETAKYEAKKQWLEEHKQEWKDFEESGAVSELVARVSRQMKDANAALKYDVGEFADSNPNEMQLILSLYCSRSVSGMRHGCASSDKDERTAAWTSNMQLLSRVCKSFRWCGKCVVRRNQFCLPRKCAN